MKQKNKKINDNLRFNILIIAIAVIGILAISSNMDSSDKITGFVVSGDLCTSANAEECDGTSVLLCINGKWENVGQIPGQCNYQTGADNPPIDDNGGNGGNDGNGWDSNTLMIILAVVLVIAILAIIGFIIYKKINKKPGNKTGMNRKPFPIGPGARPNQPGAIGQRPFLLNPMNKPALQKPAAPTSLLGADVKRYIPPKR